MNGEFDNPAILTQPSLPAFDGASQVASWGAPAAPYAPPDASAAGGLPLYDAGEAQAGLDHWGKFATAWGAAYQANTLNDMSTSRAIGAQQAVEERNKAVKQITGQDLENPTSDGYLNEAMRRFQSEGGPKVMPSDPVDLSSKYGALSREDVASVQDLQMQVYQEKLNELGQKYPDSGLDGDVRSAAIARANDAIAAAAKAAKDAGPISGTLAGLGGGLSAMWRDPLQMAGLFLGGGEASIARSVAGQMFETFVRHAAVNAAITAASEPEIAAWARERGRPMSPNDVLYDIGTAALFGGGLGTLGHLIAGAGHGDAAAARDLTDRLRTEPGGESAPARGEVPAAPDAAAEIAPALRSVVDDHEAAAGVPPNLTREQAELMMREHVRGMEREDAVAPSIPTTDPAALDAAEFDHRVELRARALDPDSFTKADELDNRIAASRSQLASQQEFRPAPALGQQRLADAQAELASIAGKRRSSPRAKALRDEIDQLQQLGEATVGSQVDLNQGTIQAIRLSLNDTLNDRARLGPKLNAARTQARVEAEAMGFTREENATARAETLPDAASRLLGQSEGPRDRAPGPGAPVEAADARVQAFPDAAAKLNGVDEPLSSRQIDAARNVEPPPAPAPKPEGEGAPNDPLADLFAEPASRAEDRGAGDVVNATPVERDGRMEMLAPGEAGAPNERVGFMSQLIENCVL